MMLAATDSLASLHLNAIHRHSFKPARPGLCWKGNQLLAILLLLMSLLVPAQSNCHLQPT